TPVLARPRADSTQNATANEPPGRALLAQQKPRTSRGFRHQNREAPLLDDPDDAPSVRVDQHAPVVDVSIDVLAMPWNLVHVHLTWQRPADHDPLLDALVAPR